MEMSIFLAKVIGLVSVISTAAIMVRYKEFIALEVEIAQNRASVYLSGFVFVLIGATLVVSHSVWILDWRLVVTLIGWAMLFKGMGRILFPEAVKRMIERKRHNHWFLLGEVVVFLIGIYLLYYGFLVY